MSTGQRNETDKRTIADALNYNGPALMDEVSQQNLPRYLCVYSITHNGVCPAKLIGQYPNIEFYCG